MLPDTAQRVLDAYGGGVFWSEVGKIPLRVSAKGMAFRMKWRPAMVEVPVVISVRDPHVRFSSTRDDGEVEVFDGDEVRIERNGQLLEQRRNPRQHFPGGRRALWWDRLDQIYFAGYALWNYVTFPALFLRDDVEWIEIKPHTLQARFADSVPTHSQVQQFHIDPDTHLLVQHDYTAEVFGSWAKAANVILEHQTYNEIPFGVRRRVTPRRANGSAAPFPILVDIVFDALGTD